MNLQSERFEMEIGKEYKAEVTQLKISKPFLKVIARSTSKKFSNQLQKLYETSCDELKLGEIHIACISYDTFERVRIVHLNEVEKIASCIFLDCCFEGFVPYRQLRLMDKNVAQFSKPPLHREFTLANISITQTSDYSGKIEVLHDMIIRKKVVMRPIEFTRAGDLVDLKIDGRCLGTIIRQNADLSSILNFIDLDRQKAIMLKIRDEKEKLQPVRFNKTLVESPEMERRGMAFVPVENEEYEIRITEYEHGPFEFYVQFIDRDVEYQKLQCSLQESGVNTRAYPNPPQIGAKCLARVNKEFIRARILKYKASCDEVEIRSLETGKKFIVSTSKLLKIPDRFDNVEGFARKYKLADIEKHTWRDITRSGLGFYFHYITNQKVLKLRIKSASEQIATCELFLNGRSIFEELKSWNPHSLKYSPQKPLRNGTYLARVCYIVTVQEFYVFLINKEGGTTPFQKISDSMKYLKPTPLNDPAIGDCCIVELQGVNYRGRIVDFLSSKIFKVEYVDLGIVEDHHEKEIKVSLNEIVKQAPPLAFRCCLKEYKSACDIGTVSDCMEDICHRLRDWKVEVVEKFETSYLVEMKSALTDENIVPLLKKQVRSLLNLSDWSEKPQSVNEYFTNRRLKLSLDQDEQNTSMFSEQTLLDESQSDWEHASVILNNTVTALETVEWEEAGCSRALETWSQDTSYRAIPSKIANRTSSPISDRASSSNWSKSHQHSPSSSGMGSVKAFPKAMFNVKLVSVDSPANFALRKLSSEVEFMAYKDRLAEQGKAQPPLTNIERGRHCLAFCSLNKTWSRSEIVDVTQDDGFLATLKCCDEGTTFCVTDKELLKVIPFELLFHRKFGIKCGLAIQFDHHETEITKFLMEGMQGDLTYRELSQYESKTIVDLYLNGKSLTDKIISRGWAKRQVYAPTGAVYIVHVASSSDFSVQSERDTDLLSQVMSFGKEYCSQFKAVKNPKVGKMIMASRNESEDFYRGIIKDIVDNEFEVEFIDFGDTIRTKEIGHISDSNIFNIPPLATRCSLDLPAGVRNLTREGEEKFKKIANNGHTKFHLNMIAPGYHSAIVELRDEKLEFIAELL